VGDTFRPRRLLGALVAVVVVLAAGAVAFRLTTDESWVNSLYRAVMTSSLTGLDSTPQGTGPRLITILLVLAGVTIFGYVAALLVEAIAGGVFTGALQEKRRQKAIRELDDHVIICGYGRVGRRVGDELRAAGADYVVLDFSEDAVAAARERGSILIEGHATDDDDLLRAGLERARGLVAAADSDEVNLYITLSARALRPDLLIVARASDEDAEKKLRRAGANRVVLPYSTAGRVMANLIVKPQVAAFLNIVTTSGGEDLSFEEIEVGSACGHAGSTIGELHIRDRTGAIVVAVRKADGTFDTRPTPRTVLGEGDVLVGVGTPDEIKALEDFFAPREPVAG